jgi:hypothetical protein
MGRLQEAPRLVWTGNNIAIWFADLGTMVKRIKQ